MAPVIRVDEEVWIWLQSHAKPFQDTPNSVLRRLAGLAPETRRARRIHEGLDVAALQTERMIGDLHPTQPTTSTSIEVAKEGQRSHLHQLLDDSRNYIVTNTSRPSDPHWWFQIYQSQLELRASNGDFSVVSVCDHRRPTEKVFSVPYRYLLDNILPQARLDPGGHRYMFEIKKNTLQFVFRGGVHFDGMQFLVPNAPQDAQLQGQEKALTPKVEPEYVAAYRESLKNPDSLPSRMKKYIDENGSLSWNDLKKACVQHLGCRSDTSGSIGASLQVLERDGYVTTTGRAESKMIFSTQSSR